MKKASPSAETQIQGGRQIRVILHAKLGLQRDQYHNRPYLPSPERLLRHVVHKRDNVQSFIEDSNLHPLLAIIVFSQLQTYKRDVSRS